MDQSLLAAIARFPDQSRAIAELAGADENFRALCADLFDAEVALNGWDCSPSSDREARCSEYRALVADLAEEIRAALERPPYR
ncbi:hypothetical protein [Bosea sp. BIWAKO-01]|uniref:hypothetical protein n=1 Tax=Bosea sp. BIWAKO-01 TaxID=506668 RepID=UPI00086A47F1|nr:hypothetical protein [Bosea sp. BIWAKO-01]GAU85935.1 hypothetical protein BIWAKO_05883 [Bosea sp. BIWAKO-01]